MKKKNFFVCLCVNFCCCCRRKKKVRDGTARWRWLKGRGMERTNETQGATLKKERKEGGLAISGGKFVWLILKLLLFNSFFVLLFGFFFLKCVLLLLLLLLLQLCSLDREKRDVEECFQ